MNAYWVVATLACVGTEPEEGPHARTTGRASEVESLEPGASPPTFPFEPTAGRFGGRSDTVDDRDAEDFLFRDVVHEIRLTLDDDAISSLRSAPLVSASGELTIDDDPVVYPLGVRLKGSASFRTIDQKPAFKIDFHEFDSTVRFHGYKRMTLNNMIQDPTMLHEYAYALLAATLGVPAPRQAYARVWVNDEEYGLYSVIEDMDEQLLHRLWPGDDEGTLYEGAGCDFVSQHDDCDREEGTDDVAFAELVTAVEATSRDDFTAIYDTYLDGDAVLAYLALDIVAGNPDGYGALRNNYYAYHAPIADRWSLMPGGVDRSFIDPGTMPRSDPRQGVLLTGCLSADACRDALEDHILATVDAWEALDLLGRVTAQEAIVGPLCLADPRHDLDCHPEEMLEYVAGRPEAIRSAFR